jgi:short-subunit dehydrogenase
MMSTTTDHAPVHHTPFQGRFHERYGPWAVVTGASDGIGLACATYLAESGLNLVLVARRSDVLANLAKELTERHSVETLVVAADLTRPSDIDNLLTRTDALEVGLLVAAAGFGTSGTFIDSHRADELEMIDVNCRAVAALGHHFGARFAQQRRGGIVFMSSLVAFQGVPRAANYAATKAYVQSLAEGLRVELGPLGVDIVASAPGPVLSGFGERADMTMRVGLTPKTVARKTLEALGRQGIVRPGWLSKALEAALALLPRRGRVRMMGIVMGGMTKHHG